MKNQYIVICDSEMLYACHLMEYLKNCGDFPTDVCVYSERSRMELDCSPDETALLVIAESQYIPDLSERYERILILNESDRDLGDKVMSISKYQSIQNILRFIQDAVPEEEMGYSVSIRHGRPMRKIGVYTPLSRCLQTRLALTMGQILSETAPALYMNFEAYCSLEQMMRTTFNGYLGDLVYYNDCAREKIPGALEKMTQKMGGLSLLPPMNSFIELHSMETSHWKSFFATLERATEYEYLLLDLSENVSNLFEILRDCDLILTITRRDRSSQSKIRQYENLLREMQYEDIYMKTIHCSFPVFRGLESDPERFLTDEFAEVVRRIAEEHIYGLQHG